jgi:hypothetical protein
MIFQAASKAVPNAIFFEGRDQAQRVGPCTPGRPEREATSSNSRSVLYYFRTSFKNTEGIHQGAAPP